MTRKARQIARMRSVAFIVCSPSGKVNRASGLATLPLRARPGPGIVYLQQPPERPPDQPPDQPPGEGPNDGVGLKDGTHAGNGWNDWNTGRAGIATGRASEVILAQVQGSPSLQPQVQRPEQEQDLTTFTGTALAGVATTRASGACGRLGAWASFASGASMVASSRAECMGQSLGKCQVPWLPQQSNEA